MDTRSVIGGCDACPVLLAWCRVYACDSDSTVEEPMKPSPNPADRLKVHTLQDRICLAIAANNRVLVCELMRELARITRKPLPDPYKKD